MNYPAFAVGMIVVLFFGGAALLSFRMISDARRILREARAQQREYEGLVMVEGTMVSALIVKFGIDEAMEVLKDNGYQVSQDDSIEGLKYTLYDPNGLHMVLNFKRGE